MHGPGRGRRWLVLSMAAGIAAGCALAGRPAMARRRADPPIDRAIRLANQGHLDQAIELLRGHLGREPKDARAREVLGQMLDFDGRPDEAVAAWEAGLAPGDESAFPLLMLIGRLEARRGADGPTISYRRGQVAAMPSKDEAAEAAFKRAHLARAASAYEEAHRLRPGDRDAAGALAAVYEGQGKADAAIALWKSLVDRKPDDAELHLGLALATRQAGRDDEAARELARAVELKPRLAEAHEALAEYQAKKGRADEAARSRKRAEFYRRLPGFCRLEYTDENAKLLDELDTEKAVSALSADPSKRASELLATLCWLHPHDQQEARAFEALEARGESTTALLRALLEDARSTCTIRSAAHILARRKVDGIFPILAPMLPNDVRGFGMDMDIAGSLDDLGDPRAVGPLGQILDPRSPESEGGPLIDRESARARAALALGAFDTGESRRLLEAGSKDPRLGPFCLASLYRIGKDGATLESLRKTVGPERRYEASVLSNYLENKVGTPEARELARVWKERLAAQRAAEEAASKKKEAVEKGAKRP